MMRPLHDETRSVRAVLRAPFTAQTRRRAWFAILSGVCLAPLIVGNAINASLQVPIITLAALALYVVGFLLLDGGRLERWRISSVLGAASTKPARRRVGRELVYLLIDIPLGCVSIGLVLAWIAISLRNVVFYPIFGWTGYPDPSWGGPTPIGAVTLHLAAGLATLLGGPWVITVVTNLQASVIDRLLGAGKDTI